MDIVHLLSAIIFIDSGENYEVKNEKKYAIIIALFIIMIISIPCIMSRIMDMKVKQIEQSPGYQPNTIWMSDNIIFSVDSNLKCLGKLRLDSEIINIQILFGKGFDTSIAFENYDVKVKENFSYNSAYTLFFGDCKFKENAFTIEVTESKIDCIKAEDEITFNRVDELPDWAEEIDSEIQNTETSKVYTDK